MASSSGSSLGHAGFPCNHCAGAAAPVLSRCAGALGPQAAGRRATYIWREPQVAGRMAYFFFDGMGFCDTILVSNNAQLKRRYQMNYAEEIQKANGLVSQARNMLEEVTCEMMEDSFCDDDKLYNLEERITHLDHVEGELGRVAPISN